MGWPDSGYLWRDGAKPAQEQYAAVAKAISEFEPLTMFANAGEVRALLRWRDDGRESCHEPSVACGGSCRRPQLVLTAQPMHPHLSTSHWFCPELCAHMLFLAYGMLVHFHLNVRDVMTARCAVGRRQTWRGTTSRTRPT